jgi:hypothetical protein
MIGRYQQFRDLLKGFDGGTITPAVMAGQGVVQSLGFQIDPKLGQHQAAEAIGNKLVLDLMGGSLGQGISNADRSYIEKMAPSLKQTATGREILVNTAISALKNQQQVAQMARQWTQRYHRIDALDPSGKSFDDYLNVWLDQHSVVSH